MKRRLTIYSLGIGLSAIAATYARSLRPTRRIRNATSSTSSPTASAGRISRSTDDDPVGGCDGKTPNCLPIMPGWNSPCVSIAPEKKSSMALGSFRRATAMIYFQEKAIHKEFTRRHGAST